jgi:phosphate transport system permease protein
MWIVMWEEGTSMLQETVPTTTSQNHDLFSLIDEQISKRPDDHAGKFPRIQGKRVKETLVHSTLFLCAVSAVFVVSFILIFLFRDGYQIFEAAGVGEFLSGGIWNPTGASPTYGAFPLIVGTLLVTMGAMLFAVPLSIGSAIFIAEIATPRMKAIIKPAVELLAGIPSVVYGFFGLIILTDWLRITFNLASGETWLAGSILLGIMALPTIISVAEDAISAVPREYKEGSLAVGANRWQTIRHVVLPAALSGITAAIILGMGRAIGETMAVLMVTGNAAVIPSPITNIFSPIRTLTGTLGIEMGEVSLGGMHYHALFGVALVLLVITLLVNLSATVILGKIREMHMPSKKKAKRFPLPPMIQGARRGLSLIAGVGGVALTAYIAGIMPAAAILLAGFVILVLRDRIPPKTVQTISFAIITLSILTVILILGVILAEIIVNGAGALSWEFLTQSPRNLGRAGGIFPAIVGTLYLVGGAILFALPIGVGAAIYLTEYTREGRAVRIIRSGVDLLNGTPSIVFGLFGFAFLVLYLNFGISLLAGQITLGLMVLPTVIRTTEEALRCVPYSLREGSYALGATRWQTIARVVLPPALPGILTGTILSIGRAAGETAPIMFTAVVFSQRFLPSSVMEPVMALPYHLFILATNVPGAGQNQYGTALVLLILVIGIYSVAIFLRYRFQRSMKW